MYMADEVQEINLKVEESKQQDVNRGIARIDPQQAEKLGLETGDVVGIIGTKETAAINWPGYPEDMGREFIGSMAVFAVTPVLVLMIRLRSGK